MTRIIRLHSPLIKANKIFKPLTKRMLEALITACEKQAEGLVFGQIDIKQSFTALVNRGLLERSIISKNETFVYTWKVTGEAILILENHGVSLPC